MRCRPRRAVTPAQGNNAVCGRLHLITRFAGASPQGEAVFISHSHAIPTSNWHGRSQIAPTEVRNPSTAAKQPPETFKQGRLISRPAFFIQLESRQQSRAVERTPGMHPYQTFTSEQNRKPGSGPAGPAREGGRWESRGNHGGTGAGSPQIPFGPSGAVLRKSVPMPMGDNPSVSLTADSSLYTREPFGVTPAARPFPSRGSRWGDPLTPSR